jgi:hypothetical protein
MATSRQRKSSSSEAPAQIVDPDSTGNDLQTVEFRKNNDSIGLRVLEGKFTLLARKLYNVFLSHAQKQGAPGQNAPTDNPADAEYFWIPMGDIVRDTRYNSNDYDTLKEHAQELLNIRVVGETEKMWVSERLLSGVKIFNSAGLKNRNGSVWLGYSFPPEVTQAVLKPNRYTKFSLYYQTELRSAASLALYEVTRRYATSPSHMTRREQWEKWYQVITSNPVKDAIPEYKYFKRDVLKGAIAEINNVTDISIELLEFKKGRRVEELQFRVVRTSQPSLPLEAGPLIDSAVIERIMRFGISKEDATDIYLSYDENTVLAHIELVESRKQSKRGPELESPAAYFRTAIKNGYASSKNVAQPVATPRAPSKPKTNLRERFILARNQEAIRYYNELSEPEQRAEFEEFAGQIDKSLKPYLKKGLETPVVRTAFGEWMSFKLWGPVTDTMVLDFLESETVQGG